MELTRKSVGLLLASASSLVFAHHAAAQVSGSVDASQASEDALVADEIIVTGTR